jgi:uncharacterized membrane protein
LLESLFEKIKKLNTQVDNLSSQLKEQQEEKPVKPIFKESVQKPIPETRPIKAEPVVNIKPVEEIPKVPETKEIIPESSVPKEKLQTGLKPEQPVPQPATANEQSWLDKWIQNNPDMEKFIGENLANKIGIAVLVLGIAFFVKYASIKTGSMKQAG